MRTGHGLRRLRPAGLPAALATSALAAALAAAALDAAGLAGLAAASLAATHDVLRRVPRALVGAWRPV